MVKRDEKFWLEIIENKDGTLNREAVLNELSDLGMIMGHCTEAYMELSNGKISNPLTLPREAIAEHQNYIDENFVWKDDLRDLLK